MTDPIKVAKKLLIDLEEHGWTSQKNKTGKTVRHATWMLKKISKGKMEETKAHRWLGYAQGVLVIYSVFTLEQMKKVNEKEKDSN